MNAGRTEQTADAVEPTLRAALARGDAMVAGSRPILRSLLGANDPALFSDELVARAGGMMLHLALQLLFAEAEAAGATDRAAYAATRQDALARALAEDDDLLAHAQAIILEARLAERLLASNAIDPVLSPLIQDLASDANAQTAELAMATLAAQARFMQHYRRMELPLAELPGDLAHRALVVQQECNADSGLAAQTRQSLGEAYREGAGREAILSRLVLEAGHPASRSLDIADAGVAIFASALALLSEDGRDRTMMGMAGPQFARLGIALRAVGLSRNDVTAQMMLLRPDDPLAGVIADLPAERASVLLAEFEDPDQSDG